MKKRLVLKRLRPLKKVKAISPYKAKKKELLERVKEIDREIKAFDTANSDATLKHVLVMIMKSIEALSAYIQHVGK